MGRGRFASFLGIGQEVLNRGLYALNALKRIATANDKRVALEKEKRYFAAHQMASQDRNKVRRLIDSAAEVYGAKLGWYLGPNENHCLICLGADGKNFYAARAPSIGYPGSAHPNCQCSPGAPFPGAPTLP